MVSGQGETLMFSAIGEKFNKIVQFLEKNNNRQVPSAPKAEGKRTASSFTPIIFIKSA